MNFEEFIKCSMNNMLMENMIDWEKVLLEEGELEKAKEEQTLAVTQQNKKTMQKGKSSRGFNLGVSGGGGYSGGATERSVPKK